MKGFDCSFQHPNWAQMYDLGYRFCGLYVGPGSGAKLLDVPTVAAIHAAGLSLMLLAEGSEDDIFQGFAMGKAHGQLVLSHVHALNDGEWIPGLIVTFAADRDITPANIGQVLEYFDGVAAAGLGVGSIGVYGDEQIIQACHDTRRASFFFHTAATAWDQGAVLPAYIDAYQGPNGLNVAGGNIDVITAPNQPRGLWQPMTTPTEASQVTSVFQATFTGGSSCGRSVPTDPTSVWGGHASNGILPKLDYLLGRVDALLTVVDNLQTIVGQLAAQTPAAAGGTYHLDGTLTETPEPAQPATTPVL